MESAVTKLNEKVTRGADEGDKGPNPSDKRRVRKLENAANETIEERVDRLSQRVDDLTLKFDGFAVMVDHVSRLSTRVDFINRYLNEYSTLLQKETERTTAMTSGLDDACRRFHHLLSSISRPLDPGELMGFYED